jgi:hypothetical protein
MSSTRAVSSHCSPSLSPGWQQSHRPWLEEEEGERGEEHDRAAHRECYLEPPSLCSGAPLSPRSGPTGVPDTAPLPPLFPNMAKARLSPSLRPCSTVATLPQHGRGGVAAGGEEQWRCAAMEEAEKSSSGRQEARDRAPNGQARAPCLDHGEGTEQNGGDVWSIR